MLDQDPPHKEKRKAEEQLTQEEQAGKKLKFTSDFFTNAVKPIKEVFRSTYDATISQIKNTLPRLDEELAIIAQRLDMIEEGENNASNLAAIIGDKIEILFDYCTLFENKIKPLCDQFATVINAINDCIRNITRIGSENGHENTFPDTFSLQRQKENLAESENNIHNVHSSYLSSFQEVFNDLSTQQKEAILSYLRDKDETLHAWAVRWLKAVDAIEDKQAGSGAVQIFDCAFIAKQAVNQNQFQASVVPVFT